MNRYKPTILLIGMMLASVQGCGPPAAETFKVTGIVTCDGNPVPTGQVSFLPTGKGKAVSGAIAPDGSYEIAAPAGACKVTIIAIPNVPMKGVTKDNWIEAFDGKSTKPLVPSYYGNPESTPFTFTIEPSESNAFDISIETKPNKKRRRRL